MPIGKVQKNKENKDLDDTAPGVLDRVKCLRLGSPYPTSGKPCSAQLSLEATSPGISTIPKLASEATGRISEKVGGGLPLVAIADCPALSFQFVRHQLWMPIKIIFSVVALFAKEIDRRMVETPFNLTCLVFSSVRSSEPH